MMTDAMMRNANATARSRVVPRSTIIVSTDQVAPRPRAHLAMLVGLMRTFSASLMAALGEGLLSATLAASALDRARRRCGGAHPGEDPVAQRQEPVLGDD